MQARFIAVLALWVAFGALPAHADLKAFACEPEWAALLKELGGDHISVTTATTADQDPHYIQARPSLIARLRTADLAVCTGADLEIGWLPLLLRSAANPRVQPGKPGYFEAAAQVERLEIPESVDRAQGDVHPAGNPHVHLDPRRIAKIADALSERLAELDSTAGDLYRQRNAEFQKRWLDAIKRWEVRAAPLRGAGFITFHKDQVYLFDWLGLKLAGTLEPLPGLPPTASHMTGLLKTDGQSARGITRNPYQDPRPGEWLAKRTALPMVTLPYTVGGSPAATDLFGLFDDTITRLVNIPR
jgi:zinc/manganese transport system substrate-binding protein